jgi:hypothetical protein
MLVLLALHAVCAAIILRLLLFLVPQSAKTFMDFDVKLPDLTFLVIELSAWFARCWHVLIPCLGAGDIAIIFLLNRAGRSRLMTAWGVLVWLAEMLLIGLVLLAVVMPASDGTMRMSQARQSQAPRRVTWQETGCPRLYSQPKECNSFFSFFSRNFP